jgi:hypothetical protein
MEYGAWMLMPVSMTILTAGLTKVTTSGQRTFRKIFFPLEDADEAIATSRFWKRRADVQFRKDIINSQEIQRGKVAGQKSETHASGEDGRGRHVWLFDSCMRLPNLELLEEEFGDRSGGRS